VREFVLNEASLESHYASVSEAVVDLDSVVRGIAALVSAGVAVNTLRASRPLHDITIVPGVNLWRLAQLAMRNPRSKDSAALFLRMSQRVPIEDGLAADMKGRLLLADLAKPGLSGATALVLCALSDRIALGLPTQPRWDVDLLNISVILLNEEGNEIIEEHFVDHLAREKHASAIADRHRANTVTAQTPQSVWQNRMSLFPHLSFGLDVENQLRQIGESVFREALQRFGELDRTAATWITLGSGRPLYLSKVSPESAATMQQYGGRRVFRDMNGNPANFELHARLQSGCRIHIRELVAERRIEIGYIGPHLPTRRY
jgi:hypothetical protein